jgi:RNA polymerase sigma factor (sigma-70 family)
MSSDTSVALQGLIDRMLQGDDSARNELVARAFDRLRRLASKILHEDFDRLKNAHETGSILDQAMLRILRGLQKVQTLTVREFFCLSATQMRRVLLDLARRSSPKNKRPNAGRDEDRGGSRETPEYEPPDSTLDPSKLAMWTEFHRKVEGLPADEREVVDLHWYQGLSQAEVAKILSIQQRQVSRLWVRAIRKLPDCVS